MTGDARMFNSINNNDSNNGKGKAKGLDKIEISNDLSI
jgi:hypothetical protein